MEPEEEIRAAEEGDEEGREEDREGSQLPRTC